jgi:hypothetical protein
MPEGTITGRGHEPPNATERDAKAVAFTIDFGALGNSADYKIAGWQQPESGFTWTLGTQSSLAFPRPEEPGRYALELHISPFVWKERLAAQRMSVAVNDEEVGKFTVEREEVILCEIPWSVLALRAACVVDFALPDSAAPAQINGVPDTRSIALAFNEVRLIRLPDQRDEALDETASASGRYPVLPPTGEALTELMMRFESLGEDCEFGLVQRRCGAEPLGLLRFSSSPLPKLIAAMEAKFEGLGTPDMIKVELASSGREYMVLDQRFGLYYHAWVLAGEKSPQEIHARECSRLPFLANKLREDLESAEKIFVYRGMKPLAENDMLKLAATMRTFGPTTLLWVELADAEHESGSVEEVAAGLLRGNIERFAPANNAHDFKLEAWIGICHNAEGLRRTLNLFVADRFNIKKV